MAESCWQSYDTPASFNGFRVLAALLHDTLVVVVSQTAALNRGRHLYSAGQPSRWALAHILVYFEVVCATLTTPTILFDLLHTNTTQTKKSSTVNDIYISKYR